MCLAPSLRAVSLLDSPYYMAALVFSLAFRNASRTCYQNKDLALKACVIPPFPLVQARSFPVVQPCSAGGDLLKDPLGLSKAINNRQNSKWGDLHWFPHCSAVCCGSWSASLRCPGFLQLMASPQVIQSLLLLPTFCWFFSRLIGGGLLPLISFVTYLLHPECSSVLSGNPSLPLDNHFPPLWSLHLKKVFLNGNHLFFFPVLLHQSIRAQQPSLLVLGKMEKFILLHGVGFIFT